MDETRNARLLAAARGLAEEVARQLDIDASIELWDGSRVPLGQRVTSDLRLTVASPGTIASLVRRPTLDRLIRHYARGNLGLEGGTLIDLGHRVGDDAMRRRFKRLGKGALLRGLLPFLTVPADTPQRSRDFSGHATGTGRRPGTNRDFSARPNLSATTTSVSPKTARRSECPTSAYRAPNSATMPAETSPVNAPTSMRLTSCEPHPTPDP